MKLVEWVKWRVAPREMEELERWRIQWEEHRRWFAEFPIAAVTLDHLKAKVEREPVTSIHVVRDSCRSADVKQVRQNHTTPPQQQAEPPSEWPLIKNILDEYGLQAISFVAEWKAAQQQSEPVAWMDREGDLYKMPEIKNWAPPHTMLYTAPPQRQWQGLTDEDCKRMSAGDKLVAMWAEAKLKEKNSD